MHFGTYIIAITTCVQLGAANYYVSPTGSGDGSLFNPWPLKMALTNAAITGGDTVWFLGGTYLGTNVVTISGTATNSVITYRNVPGQNPVIDGSFSTASCTNIWLWGLEFIDSNKTNHAVPYTTVSMQPGGNAIINCLIHDCCIGIGPHGPELIYGNILWNCGKSEPEEHGLYLQNESSQPVKLVQNNFIGRSSGFGIQAYGESGGLFAIKLLTNAIWQSGKQDILLGGAQPVVDGVIRGNHCTRGVRIGYSVANTNATVTTNYLAGNPAFQLAQQFDFLIFTNNTLVTDYSYVESARTLASLTGTLTWDRNDFYKRNGDAGWRFYWNINDTPYEALADWITVSGVDSNSVYHAPLVLAPATVLVIPNAYESKRASIIIENPGSSNTVTADVSTVLSVGDTYRLISALNYPAGTVASGTYAGGNVTVPMTNLAHAPFLYWEPEYPPPTNNISTNFGVFILLGEGPTGTTINASHLEGVSM